MERVRKFRAFISYRHLPLDIKVAEKLQNLIERYHIPQSLRQEKGKTMGLVFRDRTELPLSSDLTQDIYQALDNSEFLIVVCSRETPKSIWVDREIEYFINSHGRDRVLTVLIDGTPEESIPERITTIRSPDGNTIMEHIEPLCAYLVAEDEKTVLKNLRSELLRLIAAMLNASYDNLYQREKRYRARRLGAAAAIAATIVVIIFSLLIRWNLDVTRKNEEISNMNEEISNVNQQIQAQLYQTQLKESESLALLSEAYLSRNDRIAAVEAALQALPSTDVSRPYYSGAEAALVDALQPYSAAPYQIDYIAEHSTQVSEFCVSPNGKYLATVDSFGTLRCFDLSRKQIIWSFSGYAEPVVLQYFFFYDFLFTETELHFFTNNVVYSLSIADGKLLSSHDYVYNCLDIAPDRSGYTWTETSTSDKGIETLTVYYRNLNENQTYSADINDVSIEGMYSCMSSDGAACLIMGCRSTDTDSDNPQMFVFLYDTAKNTVRQIVTISCDADQEAAITALPDCSFLVSVLAAPTQLSVTKISASGSILAHNSIDCPENLDLSNTKTLGTGSQLAFLIPVSDQIWALWLDVNSCEAVDHATGDASLVANVRMQSDTHAVWHFANSNTYCVRNWDTGDQFDFQPAMTIEMDGWSEDAAVFAVMEYTSDSSSGNCVYIYRQSEIDADAQPTAVASPRYISPSGRLVLGFSEVGDIIILNTVTGEVHTLSDAEDANITEAVFSGDETRLIFNDGSSFDLLSEQMLYPDGWIDPDTPGSICCTLRPLDAVPGKSVYSATYHNNTLWWSQDGGAFQSIANPYAVTPEKDQYYHIQIGQNGLVILRLCQRFSLLGILSLGQWDSVAPYAIYDTNTNQWKQFPERSPEGNFANVCMAKEQKWILHTDHQGMTRLYDFETDSYLWEQMHWFDSTEMTAVFLQNDSVILVSDPSGISILNAATGEIVSTFVGATISNYIFQALDNSADHRLYLCCWDWEEETLIAYGTVIDMDAWIPIHAIPRMAGYLPSSNSILLEKADGSGRMILRPMYTLNDLILLANQLLEPESEAVP